jgi:hypothetical protein
MNKVKKQKNELRAKLEAILIMASALLGAFLVETFGIMAAFLFLLIEGALIVVYYVAVRPITARLPHQNIGETPKSFLKKCSKCGREIPIASEECPFCKEEK